MSDRLNEGEDAVWGADFSNDPVIRIEQMARAKRLLDALMESAVRDARSDKRRWSDIADAAGLTRQGATKKYAHTID